MTDDREDEAAYAAGGHPGDTDRSAPGDTPAGGARDGLREPAQDRP
ncbi:MAG: hypothetical protein HOY69_06850, partial [Streptomyces sp.]|nr:hypothetical protein [Streptomyces sp.]